MKSKSKSKEIINALNNYCLELDKTHLGLPCMDEVAMMEMEDIVNKFLPTLPTGNTVVWETFYDLSYFGLWAVRPVGDSSFQSQYLFHVQSEEEANTLKDLLERISLPLHKIEK